ncbi:hypothetical protein Tcan_10908 [Toxocara canis]|uniref:Uncharacterized protein n=1 Tax=Toxocara canis TaxID=6265 RepID=A0A0B2VGE5_TOXCA|nr:hypothetical protein Tcan_10908 [Toxocara canis]
MSYVSAGPVLFTSNLDIDCQKSSSNFDAAQRQSSRQTYRGEKFMNSGISLDYNFHTGHHWDDKYSYLDVFLGNLKAASIQKDEQFEKDVSKLEPTRWNGKLIANMLAEYQAP